MLVRSRLVSRLPCPAVRFDMPYRIGIAMFAFSTSLLVESLTVRAADLPAADLPIPVVIDQLMDAELSKRGLVPAVRADDRTLLRRTTLDLAGRIPTTAELADYEAESSSERRERLVSRLLNSADFAFHLRNEWDALLMPANESSGEWRDYLLRAARENRSWDQVFSEILIGKDDVADQRGALQFLKSRTRDLDDMTNDTSSLFFGVSINCAKCHDHPLVDDWKQDHYFGLQSFFSRTYSTRSRRLAEKPWDEVKFKTTKGEEKTAQFMFLTGAVAHEPVIERTPEQRKAENDEVRQQRDKDGMPPPAEPPFSPRLELVKLALAPENRGFLARSIVNRTWARLMGRGLVHPVDQMHSANPASHPELLDWLERDFIEHGFGVKRLIEGIVLSETYARSSQWTQQGAPPAPEAFAAAAVRPLTPKQVSLSLSIATAHPTRHEKVLDLARWSPTRDQLESQAAGFASLLEYPGEHFQVSVTEALLFSNSSRVQSEYLRDGGDRLLGLLQATADDESAVKTAFQTVLTREPASDELDLFRRYLADRADRRPAALQQMTWALLTSPEFRFNH